ncbi:MotA/TolQ/ExbB proton channel family protein [Shimia marina]|uniref:Colicin uptake protein TolQ n=1 Tax=Shimia marina TaxID=321267 RepID=A0A0P1EK14_9RHOB|nr:MotA/TolQ/ExbB proton channel family protein [Shimia marina]CUH50862.1 colicin uptake protein TolQ [Shimia marina]SFE55131.1 outer membrane transport energization protein ExbB (TC 2.C.1.1.1) [Shimia marina]
MKSLTLMTCALCLPVMAFAQTTAETAPLTAPEAPALVAPQVEIETPTLATPAAPEAEDVNTQTSTSPALQPEQPDTAEATDAGVDSPSADAVSDPATAFDEITDAEIAPVTTQEQLTAMAQTAASDAHAFLRDGGPSIWAIAALSVITLALILWKIWQLALMGAWSRGKAGKAVRAFENGDLQTAMQTVEKRRGIRSKVITAALKAMQKWDEERAREDAARVAKNQLAEARIGLSALELIATIAPLLGLLGTVLGMIAAFQALQSAGSNADPSQLAGGIWEALLTTAAGMAVAIPASAALTWFESVIDRVHRDVEDGVTRLFLAQEPKPALHLVAE